MTNHHSSEPGVTFEGEWGGTWTYDPSQALAPAGGFGTVFAGASESAEPVAVKVISPTGVGLGADRLQRREVEIAELLRDVHSENLMSILDVGRLGEDVLLVMPRAEGSLAANLPLDIEDAIVALRDIAHGLQELHSASVIHRDLKPGNVLLFEGRWRLADFGIARDAALGTQTATYAGSGTLPYMAPELWVPPFTPTAKSAYSMRQASMITWASSSVLNSSPFRSWSRTVPLNDSTKGFPSDGPRGLCVSTTQM